MGGADDARRGAGQAARPGLRQRLASGEVMLGAFAGFGDPAAVEIMAWRGFDVVLVDQEHGTFAGTTDVAALVRAADAAGAECLVRVGGLGVQVAQALDAGVRGIVVPQVESAEHAAACVSASHYPPRGTRGAGLGRAAAYGQRFRAYVERASAEVVVAVQIETQAGVVAAKEIAAVDGVDLVFVGPGDLAVSMGVDPGSGEHVDAIRDVLAAGRDAGRHTGIVAGTAEHVRLWSGEGAQLLVLGEDLLFLGSACERVLAEARAALGSTDTTER